MKKKLVLMLSCMMAFGLVLTGCGNTDSAADSSAATEESAESSESAGEAAAEGLTEDISAADLLAPLGYDPLECVKLPADYMNQSVELVGSQFVEGDPIDVINNDWYGENGIKDYVQSDKKVVEDGDRINLDYEGKVDGVAFDGGTAQDQTLVIGSGRFIPGFEDQLVGVNVGDTVDIEVTFPEEYPNNPDLAGKPAVFTCTVNYVYDVMTHTYDTLTDEIVERTAGQYYDIKTVDELYNYIKDTYIPNVTKSHIDDEINTRVSDFLVNNSEVTIPESEKERVKNLRLASFQDSADKAGVTLEEYVKSNGYESMEEMEEELDAFVESSLKADIILQAVIADQNLTLTADEYNSSLAYFKQSYGYDEAALGEIYGGIEMFRVYIAEQMAYQKVLDSFKYTISEE